ncbi:MAG: cation/multidrug efflux pump, partial [Gammaproteobacteria bacterium]|nr:cation/multidrug efflux pump [Gammaproteobacteria bacterium]
YRLERLSGRYRDVEQARRARHTVHALARDPGPDLWRLAERHPRWVPWVDAHYGNAAYMPMADGARFAVAVSASGLVARPLNAPAREALAGWSR